MYKARLSTQKMFYKSKMIQHQFVFFFGFMSILQTIHRVSCQNNLDSNCTKRQMFETIFYPNGYYRSCGGNMLGVIQFNKRTAHKTENFSATAKTRILPSFHEYLFRHTTYCTCGISLDEIYLLFLVKEHDMPGFTNILNSGVRMKSKDNKVFPFVPRDSQVAENFLN